MTDRTLLVLVASGIGLATSVLVGWVFRKPIPMPERSETDGS